MSEEAKWYVIHTYSGYENKVASTLQTTVENLNHIGEFVPDGLLEGEGLTV